MTSGNDDRSDLGQVLARINAAWRAGRFDDLRDCFHEDMVTVTPGFEMRVEGRGPCIQSYREFMSAAKVTTYKESEASIDVFGDTAVASFGWEMTWEMHGQSHNDSGRDLFVFTRQAGHWLAVWRTLITQPPSQ